MVTTLSGEGELQRRDRIDACRRQRESAGCVMLIDEVSPKKKRHINRDMNWTRYDARTRLQFNLDTWIQDVLVLEGEIDIFYA